VQCGWDERPLLNEQQTSTQTEMNDRSSPKTAVRSLALCPIDQWPRTADMVRHMPKTGGSGISLDVGVPGFVFGLRGAVVAAL